MRTRPLRAGPALVRQHNGGVVVAVADGAPDGLVHCAHAQVLVVLAPARTLVFGSQTADACVAPPRQVDSRTRCRGYLGLFNASSASLTYRQPRRQRRLASARN